MTTALDPAESFEMLPGGRDEGTPERKLWLAVVLNVWKDAFERENTSLECTEDEGRRRIDPEVIRGDARRWLCSNLPGHKEARELVCDLADIDPNALQRAAIEKRGALRAKDEERSSRTYERTKRMLDERLERLARNGTGHSDAMLDNLLGKLAELEEMRL